MNEAEPNPSISKVAGYIIGGVALGSAGVVEINYIDEKFNRQIEIACQCTQTSNPQGFAELKSYYEDYYLLPSAPGVAAVFIGGSLIIAGVWETIKLKRRAFRSQKNP